MFEDSACFEKFSAFRLVEDDGKFVGPFEGRQFDDPVLHIVSAKQKPQSVNSVFEVGLGRLLWIGKQMLEVSVDLLIVQQSGNAFEVKADFGDASSVVQERGFRQAAEDDFLFEFGE